MRGNSSVTHNHMVYFLTFVTIKEGDGSICGTETQMGGAVMPGDTITLCGMVSVPASSLADDTDILFDIEWKDFVNP